MSININMAQEINTNTIENMNQLFPTYPGQPILVTDAAFISIVNTAVKYAFIFFIFFYLMSSIALIKQIKLMNKTVVSPLNKSLIFIGFLHLIFVLFILLLTIFAL